MLVTRSFCMSVFLLLGGCGSGARPQSVSSAASIQYQLPITSAKVSVDLTLQDCTSGPVAAAKVTISAVANPNPAEEQRFRLYGANLASFNKNRQVAIELHPNGAIKSINGGVSDRTGALITNVLKTAASFVGFGTDDGTGKQLSGACNTATNEALTAVTSLKGRISGLRSGLSEAAPADAEATRLAIDALAAEIARLRGPDGPLNLKLEREIEFRKGRVSNGSDEAITATTGGQIQWAPAELSKWLTLPPKAAPTTLFSMGYCVSKATDYYKKDAVKCLAGKAAAGQRVEDAANGAGDVQKASCYDTNPKLSCKETIVFREPVPAVLVIISTSPTSLAQAATDKKMAAQDISISQWGDLDELALQVGLGDNFAMSAGFDEFGRRSSFSWKSDARGEALTGALSSVVDAAGALNRSFNTDLETQQAEITRLETQQKLNKLAFCREVIEAGGFTCP